MKQKAMLPPPDYVENPHQKHSPCMPACQHQTASSCLSDIHTRKDPTRVASTSKPRLDLLPCFFSRGRLPVLLAALVHARTLRSSVELGMLHACVADLARLSSLPLLLLLCAGWGAGVWAAASAGRMSLALQLLLLPASSAVRGCSSAQRCRDGCLNLPPCNTVCKAGHPVSTTHGCCGMHGSCAEAICLAEMTS